MAAKTGERGKVVLKSVYTTGEVAQICNISQQTVIRCFDNGKLKGFRVPGSRFRRIPRENLTAFMKENNIPLDNLETGKKRVLVVDDDTEILSMLAEVLSTEGYEIATAKTGYDAGVMTEAFRPDVMLLDFKLPDVNGTAVCRTVRSNPNFAHMKIIMMSGVADPDEISDLMACGADEFFKKPFHMKPVVDRLAELVTI